MGVLRPLGSIFLFLFFYQNSILSKETTVISLIIIVNVCRIVAIL